LPYKKTLPLEDIESEPEIITSKDIKKNSKPNGSGSKESEENLAYIKQLQEEEERAYQEEMQRRRKLNEDFESKMICNICLTELMSEKIIALDTCDHVYHESCVKEFVLSEIKAKKAMIACPDSECKIEINIESLRDVLNKKDIELFYKNTLEIYVDTHAADVFFLYFVDFFKILMKRCLGAQLRIVNLRSWSMKKMMTRIFSVHYVKTGRLINKII